MTSAHQLAQTMLTSSFLDISNGDIIKISIFNKRLVQGL